MTEYEKSLWDQAVIEYELSGNVTPKSSHARKYRCDPKEWAAKKLYQRKVYHSPSGRAKHGRPNDE